MNKPPEEMRRHGRTGEDAAPRDWNKIESGRRAGWNDDVTVCRSRKRNCY